MGNLVLGTFHGKIHAPTRRAQALVYIRRADSLVESIYGPLELTIGYRLTDGTIEHLLLNANKAVN